MADFHRVGVGCGIFVCCIALDLVLHIVGTGVLALGDSVSPSGAIQAVLHGAAVCGALSHQLLLTAVILQAGLGSGFSCVGGRNLVLNVNGNCSLKRSVVVGVPCRIHGDLKAACAVAGRHSSGSLIKGRAGGHRRSGRLRKGKCCTGHITGVNGFEILRGAKGNLDAAGTADRLRCVADVEGLTPPASIVPLTVDL